MTDYYVDPDLGTGNEDGTDAANAWHSLQDAVDGLNNTGKPAAGDSVLLKHGTGNDETPSAIIDFDVAEGTSTGIIKWVGVNSSWAEDGTRYIIDGGSTATSLFNMVTDYHYFKNIELNNSQVNCIDFEGNALHPMIFDSCRFYNPTSACFDTYCQGMIFYKCHLTSAGADGYYRPNFVKFIFCVISDNTGDGLDIYHYTTTVYGCIIHNNGGNGILLDAETGQDIYSNVIDGNTGDGIQVDASVIKYWGVVLANRITNNAKGIDIDANAHTLFEDYNFYLNNTTAAREGGMIEGGNSLVAGTEGYNDRDNNDFNLTSSATLRRTAIDMEYGT